MYIQNNPYQSALQSIGGYGAGFTNQTASGRMNQQSNYSMPFGSAVSGQDALPEMMQQLTGLVQGTLQILSDVITKLTSMLGGKQESSTIGGLTQQAGAKPVFASDSGSISDIFSGITNLFSSGEKKESSGKSDSSWISTVVDVAGSIFGAFF